MWYQKVCNCRQYCFDLVRSHQCSIDNTPLVPTLTVLDTIYSGAHSLTILPMAIHTYNVCAWPDGHIKVQIIGGKHIRGEFQHLCYMINYICIWQYYTSCTQPLFVDDLRSIGHTSLFMNATLHNTECPSERERERERDRERGRERG